MSNATYETVFKQGRVQVVKKILTDNSHSYDVRIYDDFAEFDGFDIFIEYNFLFHGDESLALNELLSRAAKVAEAIKNMRNI